MKSPGREGDGRDERVLRIGLTGGIACGKSTVRRRLRASGLQTLDLDGLAHELMAPGQPAHAEVAEVFGPGVLAPDGSIDRRVLGALVFRNPELLKRLNAIVHPRVRAEEALRARALESGPGAVLVTDAALLVESGLHLRFDRLVVVHCRPEQQVARLVERDFLSEEEARARVLAQMPTSTKRRFGHFTIDSSGQVADSERAAAALARTIQGLAQDPPRPFPVPFARALGALVHGPASGPRGLTPLALAEQVTRVGELDVQGLAGLLRPPTPGPWYEAGVAPAGTPETGGPAALVAPLVLFDMARRGHDPDRLAAIAHSLAWLTDREPDRIGEAVFMAVALGQIFVSGRVPADLASSAHPLRVLAERWAGAPLGAHMEVAARAAVRFPRDPRAAREVLSASGAEPGLAGALVGAATGALSPQERSRASLVWGGFLDDVATVPS